MTSPLSPVTTDTKPPAPPPGPDLVATLVVDARGLRCPLPLLRAKQALRGMSAGALLQVVATDAASVADFAAYARLSGEDLMAFCVQADEYTYWFRKR